jgi:hypothetical protein
MKVQELAPAEQLVAEHEALIRRKEDLSVQGIVEGRFGQD